MYPVSHSLYSSNSKPNHVIYVQYLKKYLTNFFKRKLNICLQRIFLATNGRSILLLGDIQKRPKEQYFLSLFALGSTVKQTASRFHWPRSSANGTAEAETVWKGSVAFVEIWLDGIAWLKAKVFSLYHKHFTRQQL